MIGARLLDFMDACSELQMIEVSLEDEWEKPDLVIKGSVGVIRKAISSKLCICNVLFIDSHVENGKAIIRAKITSGNAEDD